MSKYGSVREICAELEQLCAAGGRGEKARFADNAGVPRIVVSQITRGHSRRTLPKRVLKALNYHTEVYYKRRESR